MTTITLKGKPIHTIGTLPMVGTAVPPFTLTKTDLSELSLSDLHGHKVILNIFPSLDTATCAISVRKFNEVANQLSKVKVLCVSADLPFAQSRFCGAENLQNVIPVSVFRHPEFGEDFGVKITDGPLAGLLSRAVVIINEKDEVVYTQQVPEITQEPDYQAALKLVS